MPVGARIVLRPERHALSPIAIEAPAIPIVGARREHKPGEGPFRGLLPVGCQLELVIFDSGVLAERFLKRIQHAETANSEANREQLAVPAHQSAFFRRIPFTPGASPN